VLVNPTNPTASKQTLQALDPAGRSLGLQLKVLNASASREIDAAFAGFAQARPDAVFVSQDPFLNSRRLQLSMLAMRHGLPASYSGREYAEVGGLMSYGSNIADAYREVGVYGIKQRAVVGRTEFVIDHERRGETQFCLRLGGQRNVDGAVDQTMDLLAEGCDIGARGQCRVAIDQCDHLR
jgi:hypothetical protein